MALVKIDLRFTIASDDPTLSGPLIGRRLALTITIDLSRRGPNGDGYRSLFDAPRIVGPDQNEARQPNEYLHLA